MTVEVYFGRQHDEIIKILNTAQTSLEVAVAWIAFKIYGDIFLALAKRGVKVHIFCTDSHSNRIQTHWLKKLQDAGVICSLCTMPNKWNFMHHKFAIVDKQVVINGSFNWSMKAPKSFENVLVIKDEPDLTRKFLVEFARLKELDVNKIRNLQRLDKCKQKKCKGKQLNFLLYESRHNSKTCETEGQLIQLCSDFCGAKDVIDNSISDRGITTHFNSYELIDEDNDTPKFLAYLDLQRDLYLTKTKIKNHVIHAIGVLDHRLSHDKEEDIWSVEIVWKNKFVDQYIRNRYDREVFYD